MQREAPADTVGGANPYASPVARSSTTYRGEIPPLARDPAFWGMNVTQFLGAFNDNLFKQLLLLLATPAAAQVAAGNGEDRQSEMMFVFAAAFLIFSGFAGWLADRTVKRRLIIASKVAEIVVMTLGLIGFFYYDSVGLRGMMVVLFLMGAQSAFFGPPKYGILPEILRDSDLPKANGMMLMFTFLAIIFGTAVVAALGASPETAWRTGACCVIVAVVGTLTALLVRASPIANPGAPLRWSDALVPPEMIRLVTRDREILLAVIVTSCFWMLGGVCISCVNALGKTQLGIGALTSALAAMVGVGIPIGCILGGYLSRGRINPRIVTTGAIGILFTLLLMSMPWGPKDHTLGFYGSIPVLIALGFFTGLFVVPIQVSLQVRPAANEKGRMIALVNQANWVGIILGAGVFELVITALENGDHPRCLAFLAPAAIMAPVALFYRPQELRLGE